MANIKKSVGFGGENDPVDVCTIQYLLNCVPTANGGPTEELPVDGARHGGGFTKMVIAIRRFQSRIFQGWSDGRVDPGGQTLAHLKRWNPADPSYGAYVKHGAGMVKGDGDQSFKTIKGAEDAVRKGISEAADATLKAVQAAVKQSPGFKEGPWQKGSGDPHSAVFGKLSESMQKVAEGALKASQGIKGGGVKGGGGGLSGAIKGVTDAALKASGGIKGAGVKGAGGMGGGISGALKGVTDAALKAAGGNKGGDIKGSGGSGGAMGGIAGAVKGLADSMLKAAGGIKGDGVKGGFTDPFNMKGGGGGVNPGPGVVIKGGGQNAAGQNIKGSLGPTVIN